MAAGRMSAWSHGRAGVEPEECEELIWATPHRLMGEDVFGIQALSGRSNGDHHSRVAMTPNKSAV
jgi:hypothetical protein